MKIDSHVLFLIIIIGVISAGIVGATVMSNDTSMKQEVFDGITVSVPADSDFVKVDNGVYKDSNYGIQINTFKNNNSMIDFLKNTKKSKIVPVENQPPQSVAFKKGDTINILVTNGQEGVSVSSKDGELTSKIANNIIFSNNHKSQKPAGIPLVKPHMNSDQDFNLIMILIAEVDTKIFNPTLLENNVEFVVNDYNNAIGQPEEIILDDGEDNAESDNLVSDISNDQELNDVLSNSSDTSSDEDDLTEALPGASDTSSNDNNNKNENNDNDDEVVAQATPANDNSPSAAFGDSSSSNDVASSDMGSNNMASNTPSPSSSGSSNGGSSQQQEMSVEDCKQLAFNEIKNHPELQIDANYGQVTDGYEFNVVDNTNNIVGKIVVNALTGSVDIDDNLRHVL